VSSDNEWLCRGARASGVYRVAGTQQIHVTSACQVAPREQRIWGTGLETPGLIADGVQIEAQAGQHLEIRGRRRPAGREPLRPELGEDLDVRTSLQQRGQMPRIESSSESTESKYILCPCTVVASGRIAARRRR
jgi:hypothetical protein